jgi:lantibiotic transport system ATP-binding protein
MHAISIQQLSHQFTKQLLNLDNISLNVPQGSIYGFLGPNGAGKTTTIRLMLGLLQRQQGEVSFWGKPFFEHRIEVLKKIGSLIESPSMYGHLTAVENLQLLQQVYQCPKSRIEEVLKMVDLADTGNKKTQQFSLGMKQRLGIAIALLHDPELLILDEPTNGLDPNGMVEMRELLLHVNRNFGKTILVSSHLLAEIEKMATHVGIIHQGKMRFEGTLDDLLLQRQNASEIQIKCNDTAFASQVIASHFVSQIIDNQNIIIKIDQQEDIAAIVKKLVTQGVNIYEVTSNHGDLESIFMEMVK